MTRFELLVNAWKDCTRCGYHATRTQVVQARGRLPADVAFVGEAPGVSEDTLGSPFVGEAGNLLDRIVARAVPPGLRLVFLNLVGCVPVDPETGRKALDPPSQESVTECQPRLVELLDIAQPKLVVCLGKEAGDWLQQGYLWSPRLPASVRKVACAVHPAFVLRSPMAVRSLNGQKLEVAVRDAVLEVFGEV